MDENTVPPSSSYSSPPPGIPPVLPATSLYARRPPRRNGWRIAAIILGVLLIFSLLSHVGMILSSVVNSIGGTTYANASRLEEVVIESHDSANKIAVIPVVGLIFDGSVDRGGYTLVKYIQDQLDLAGRDPHVRAVLLKVDSPGGEVLASDNISQAIADFQKKTGKPIIASMGSVAASGGYYVSSHCRWLVANELTITGSIGVIMHNYNYRGLMDKIGVRPQVFKSGRFKDMLSSTRELENLSPQEKATLDEEAQMVQQLIDETFKRFKEVVAAGRQSANKLNQGNAGAAGRPLVEDWEKYADGRILSGKQAYEYGFVDELGNWQTAVKRAYRLANIQSANLVQYQQPFELSNLFRILGKSEPPSIKLDLGMDLPKLRAGLLYFLSPTYVQ